MSVFDGDIIKKDLPLETLLREKIAGRIEAVVYGINERSANGVREFSRLSEPGAYGVYDTHVPVWHDRFSAFTDYITVSLKILQSELTRNPIIHNKDKVFIDDINCFNNYLDTAGYVIDSLKESVVIKCHKFIKKGIHPWSRESYVYNFNFDISLDPPVDDPFLNVFNNRLRMI